MNTVETIETLIKTISDYQKKVEANKKWQNWAKRELSRLKEERDYFKTKYQSKTKIKLLSV